MNEMDVSEEMLMALADGEMDAASAARLRERVAQDPALARRLAVYETTAQSLREAMDPGPVPGHLVQAIMGAQPVRVIPFPRRVLAPALAAALTALAFGAGGYWLGQRGAAGADALAAADLPTGETRALADGSTLRALGSYATEAGLCRLIAQEGGARDSRSVICREETGWRLALEVSAPGAGDFIPASDPLATVPDVFLDDLGAGPALSAAEEAAALRETR